MDGCSFGRFVRSSVRSFRSFLRFVRFFVSFVASFVASFVSSCVHCCSSVTARIGFRRCGRCLVCGFCWVVVWLRAYLLGGEGGEPVAFADGIVVLKCVGLSRPLRCMHLLAG